MKSVKSLSFFTSDDDKENRFDPSPALLLFAITPLLVGANDPKKIRLHLDLGLKILGFFRIVHPIVGIPESLQRFQRTLLLRFLIQRKINSNP